MPDSIIRWLHLADFHTGKDDYGQKMLCEEILKYVKRKCDSDESPDLVFITGDIANMGKQDQYEKFYIEFYAPLEELIGQRKIYMVPGNHDVDIAKAKTIQRKNVLEEFYGFFDPTPDGQDYRAPLLPRFEEYMKLQSTVENPDEKGSSNWLEKGYYTALPNINGTKIGILGLNTAWLSGDKNEISRLSPGTGLVKAGLGEIKDCSFRIVLGHHPLDWFLPNERDSISALLGKNHALYLCGHLHKGDGRIMDGAGNLFLCVKTGSAFQARADSQNIWVNGFLWCELDTGQKHLTIAPKKWIDGAQDWTPDSDAFPPARQVDGTDKWGFPLDGHTMSDSAKAHPKKIGYKLPDGWQLIDKDFLQNHNKPLDDNRAMAFFDGAIPNWQEALAKEIPRRSITEKLTLELAASDNNKAHMSLLIGPGGEGKSIAIRQVTCDLVMSGKWLAIWHEDNDLPANLSFVSNLPNIPGIRWLIVSDDAHQIVEPLSDIVSSAKLRGKDVCFLLCCRDIDWYATEKGKKHPWQDNIDFKKHEISGIDLIDATLVVTAWNAYGQEGMKKLWGLSIDDAALALVKASKDEEEHGREDGAFLGAMLKLRYADDLREHVAAILDRLLKSQNVYGKIALLDAFAYIAAMHAENLPILTKNVLVEALGLDPKVKITKVIQQLGMEAAATARGQVLVTRHRTIAEHSIALLEKRFEFDMDKVYSELVQSAIQVYLRGDFVFNLGQWRFLCDHFFDKNNRHRAISLAKAALDMESGSPNSIVKYAQILRKSDQLKLSVQVFRDTNRFIRGDRVYYAEWGAGEGNMGNHALDVWLSALSLADCTADSPPAKKQAQISLTGLGTAFTHLHENFGNIFIVSCGASAQLRLKLPGQSESDERYLNKDLSFSRGHNVPDMDWPEAFAALERGIRTAGEYIEDRSLTYLPIVGSLKFRGLKKLFEHLR